MNNPDPYYGVDKLQDDIERISSARADWLEVAAAHIVEQFKAELKDEGELVEHNLQEAEIILMAAEAGVSFDKFLFDLAWQQADESGLSEKLSWG